MSEVKAARQIDFKEVARRIVAEDRELRKFGYHTDTGGKIARALEKAYQRGLREAVEGPPVATTPQDNHANWWAIPTRARSAFWTICLWAIGENVQSPEGRPYRLTVSTGDSGRSRVQFETEDAGEMAFREEWGLQTIRPLIKMGIVTNQSENRLVMTEYGFSTWVAAVRQCESDIIELVGTIPPEKWNI